MPRKGQRFHSQEELQVRDKTTAALLGAGIPDDSIAAQQGISKRTVQKIRKEIRTDDDLRDVFEESQRKHMPHVLEVASLALEAMERGLRQDKCPVHHAAAAYRELVKSQQDAMIRIEEKGGDTAPPTKDADILVELLRKMFADERKRAAAVTVETKALEAPKN